MTEHGTDLTNDFADRGGAALVVGGSGRPGAAICRELAVRGSDVALTYRTNSTVAESVAADISEWGRRAWTVGLELEDSRACVASVDAIAEAAGGIHTLIHAAGSAVTEGFTTVADACMSHLRASGGSIVAISDGAAARPALDDRPDGVRVNTIGVDPLVDDPTGLVEAVCFLASRRAGSIIGQHLRVEDGPSAPVVAFLCVHNAGRSQMAAGFLRHLAAGRVEVLSAGSAPGDVVNPVAVAAMAEHGIDISTAEPRRWTDSEIEHADLVVTMGCGDACPVYPGTRYEDWPLDDPAGEGIEAVRPIRDEIAARVLDLMSRLGVESTG